MFSGLSGFLFLWFYIGNLQNVIYNILKYLKPSQIVFLFIIAMQGEYVNLTKWTSGFISLLNLICISRHITVNKMC